MGGGLATLEKTLRPRTCDPLGRKFNLISDLGRLTATLRQLGPRLPAGPVSLFAGLAFREGNSPK